MTANLLISNGDVAAIAATVIEQDPDVVALQELGHDHAEYFADHLRARYPYQVLEPYGAPWGLGVLSRVPLERHGPTDAVPNACGCQRVRIEHAGRAVTILNVHPAPPTVRYARLGRLPVPTSLDNDETETMLRRALQELDGVADPVIVLGDFNVGDRQPFYRWLRHDFEDAHRQAGWGFGFTFPNVSFEGAPPVPLVRIDYIFHDRSWTARTAWNGTIPGSDHRYVVADLVRR
jgi:vancomycin resistance protein VanJ